MKSQHKKYGSEYHCLFLLFVINIFLFSFYFYFFLFGFGIDRSGSKISEPNGRKGRRPHQIHHQLWFHQKIILSVVIIQILILFKTLLNLVGIIHHQRLWTMDNAGALILN